MKKKILAIVLATTALVNIAPATATAKTAHTYKVRGTVRNFSYTYTYEDGERHFNTSHVTFYRNIQQNVRLLKIISIHPMLRFITKKR